MPQFERDLLVRIRPLICVQFHQLFVQQKQLDELSRPHLNFLVARLAIHCLAHGALDTLQRAGQLIHRFG
jgi:hypothetical protein